MADDAEAPRPTEPILLGTGKPRFPPAVAVAVAVAAVSFAAPLFRLADAPAVTASFWRLAFAVLLLLPFSWHCWQAWRRSSAQDWLATILAGVALGLHFALWVTSLEYTTVAASTCLVTLQAIFVALGGDWLLGDRLGSRAWLGVALAVAGATLIASAAWLTGGQAEAAEAQDALLGNVLALLAGVCSAAYFVVGRRLRVRRGLVEYVLPVYAVAAVALLAALPLVDQPLLTGLGDANFAWFVLLAAVPMLGGHTVSNWVLKYLPAHTVATWILLEPVGAALLAWGIPSINEVPTWPVALGGAIALGGALLTIPRRAGAAVAAEPAG